jgi:hypothetical protein
MNRMLFFAVVVAVVCAALTRAQTTTTTTTVLVNYTCCGDGLASYCASNLTTATNLCTNTTRNSTASERLFGLSFGATSRCVRAPDLIVSGSVAATGSLRCLATTCLSTGAVRFTLPDAATVTCNASGLAGTVDAPAGWAGTIECPAYASICDSSLTATATTTSTTATTTTITTVSATPGTTASALAPTTNASELRALSPGYTVRIAGGLALRSLFDSDRARLLAAVADDLASILAVRRSALTVTLLLENTSASVLATAMFVSVNVAPTNWAAAVSDSAMLASASNDTTLATAWLVRTQALFAATVANSRATVTSATSNYGLLRAALTNPGVCSHGCALFIAASLLCGSLLIAIGAFLVRDIVAALRPPKLDETGPDAGERQAVPPPILARPAAVDASPPQQQPATAASSDALVVAKPADASPPPAGPNPSAASMASLSPESTG